MKILITGGLGFLGCNLAYEGLKKGHDILVVDNFYKEEGNIKNYTWLKQFFLKTFKFQRCDLRNEIEIKNLITKFKPEAVFHVAGQVAMTKSIEDPINDFKINAMGTINLLNALNENHLKIPVIYSSTNKVYGDLEKIEYIETETRYIPKKYKNGFDENLNLDFQSPYGCSKGCADQYVLDFSRIFGVKGIVFRHSTMYGGRQYATEDQGWIGWFIEKCFEVKNKSRDKIEISGNGKQVRDLLNVKDLVNLYYIALENSEKLKGNAFNIGGGYKNSFSLIEFFKFMEQELNIKIKLTYNDWRVSDQKVFIADISKIQKQINWKPTITKEEGIKDMLKWVMSNDK